MTTFSWPQAAAWRLAQHGLLERAPQGDLLPLVTRIIALHAQVLSCAELAAWQRVEGLGPSDIRDAVAGPHAGQDLGHARHAAPGPRHRAAAGRRRGSHPHQLAQRRGAEISRADPGGDGSDYRRHPRRAGRAMPDPRGAGRRRGRAQASRSCARRARAGDRR